MEKLKLTIGHLYPDLLNLYGDRGNIIALQKRCEWRGIETEVIEFQLNSPIDFNALDIVFLGGGSDREQLLVGNRLKEIKDDINRYVDNNGVVIAICGGYQLLGHYYKLKDETIEGLSVLDIYTDTGDSRMIGNVVIECNLMGNPVKVVGFENHGGKTYINNHQPLGIVKYGYGNNGTDGTEGVIYKNVIGTYLHGPLLPKNPVLTDFIISNALKRAYPDTFTQLQPLDDSIELKARDYIVNRFLGRQE
ncbi:MAG: glutamine amidotransferase [Clostridiaceae bacterium]|nr:glutamine amidotransferase [Clostridiaceae bacterium]